MKTFNPPPLSTVSKLSDAGYKVLARLQRGCAYRVHGAWRFRGSHSPINGATVVLLLTKGLAERVHIDSHVQVRITPAGSLVNRKSLPRQ
jgi:hypothetical protein